MVETIKKGCCDMRALVYNFTFLNMNVINILGTQINMIKIK